MPGTINEYIADGGEPPHRCATYHAPRSVTVLDPTILSLDPHGSEREDRRLALRYYIQSFSPLLTTNIENNCFLSGNYRVPT